MSDHRLAARLAALAGVLGLIACAVGAMFDRRAFFEAYLIAWWFYLGISLGGFAILMVHHLTGGHWGRHIRPPLEAAARTLPLLAMLFVPLLFGIGELYVWARPESIPAGDPLRELLRSKRWYLNEPFFLLRAVIYFAVWLLLAQVFAKVWKSASSEPTEIGRLSVRAWSTIGLILYALTITFASTDWIMSLIPSWYSTTFGLLSGVSQSLGGFAFGIVGASLVPELRAGAVRASAQEFNDLGNLLLMFVMLWAYLAFTQYLIVWSEDLRNENAWYLPRVQTSWRAVGVFLIVFQFAAPFFVLLFREAKRRVGVMLTLGAGLLIVRWIDTIWVISPSLHPEGVYFHWIEGAAMVGIGGLWLASVLWLSGREAAGIVKTRREEPEHG